MAVQDLGPPEASLGEREEGQDERLLEIRVGPERVVVVAALETRPKPPLEGVARRSRESVGAEVEILKIRVQRLVQVVVETDELALVLHDVVATGGAQQERRLVAMHVAVVWLERRIAVVLDPRAAPHLPSLRRRGRRAGGKPFQEVVGRPRHLAQIAQIGVGGESGHGRAAGGHEVPSGQRRARSRTHPHILPGQRVGRAAAALHGDGES